MIVTTTRITVSSANRSELFQTILTLLTPLKNEKGCLSSRFYLDSADQQFLNSGGGMGNRRGLGKSFTFERLRRLAGRGERSLQSSRALNSNCFRMLRVLKR